MRQTRTWIGLALVGALIVAVAVGSVLLRSGRTGDGGIAPDVAPQPAFPAVEALRAELESCTAELAAEQQRFSDHEARVDSLRAAVDGYESEERTVPAEVFDAYMETFDAYNASVRAWEDHAAALQARWEECHDLAERHNALVDSLSGRAPLPPTPEAG